MASRPKITGRKTTLAAAFVQAIIPRLVNAESHAALFDEVGVNPEQCVYCGARATDMDHFRALVKHGRPSGYFHTIYNLVPSCGPCNQSKNGADWQAWMLGRAKGSPTTRKVPDIEKRIECLIRFQQAGAHIAKTVQEQLRQAAGAELWDGYWLKLEEIKRIMAEAQKDAEEIQTRLAKL